jgi:hypothetical protein
MVFGGESRTPPGRKFAVAGCMVFGFSCWILGLGFAASVWGGGYCGVRLKMAVLV